MSGWGTLMGGDLVTFRLIGGAEHHLNRAVMENPVAPKFQANQIERFFYTKFQHHGQHQNEHHD